MLQIPYWQKVPVRVFEDLLVCCHRHAPTYETATIRRFYHARTETVRSCTPEACRWCQAMGAKSGSVSGFVFQLLPPAHTACTHACMCARTHTCMHACIYACACEHTHMHTHTHTHTHTYAGTNTNTHTVSVTYIFDKA